MTKISPPATLITGQNENYPIPQVIAMNIHMFTVQCPVCGMTTRTRARSVIDCTFCESELTLDDITIVRMEKCEMYEDALLMTS